MEEEEEEVASLNWYGREAEIVNGRRRRRRVFNGKESQLCCLIYMRITKLYVRHDLCSTTKIVCSRATRGRRRAVQRGGVERGRVERGRQPRSQEMLAEATKIGYKVLSPLPSLLSMLGLPAMPHSTIAMVSILMSRVRRPHMQDRANRSPTPSPRRSPSQQCRATSHRLRLPGTSFAHLDAQRDRYLTPSTIPSCCRYALPRDYMAGQCQGR